MKILVVGGAGYIGSHMCKLLAARGHEHVVYDNLSTGHREAVLWGPLVEGSLHDTAALDRLFSAHAFDAVIHFAGSIAVGESTSQPLQYYRNNVGGSLELFSAMKRHGVRRLILSSTAAIYGEPAVACIDESLQAAPMNPYGRTKWMTEQVLQDLARAGEMDAVALRYFNAAGADPEGMIGEAHDPETHLIPLLLKSVLGQGPMPTLFGDDYPTADGSCVRDYVHVSDLCEAHLLAVDFLTAGNKGFHAFNLGTGKGHSVKQVHAAVERAVGRLVPITIGPRRAGDPAVLVASNDLAQKVLGWSPRMRRIDDIVESALQWHRHPRF